MSEAGHEADIGQRRVPATDIRRVEEHGAEVVVTLERLETLAGVGHRDEARAGVVEGRRVDGIEGRFGPLPCRRLEGVRLRRRARLAGDDDEGSQRIEVVEDGGHGRRVRRVKDAQVEVAVLTPERPVQDVRGEAAAAHPGDDRGGESVLDDAVAEALEARDLAREMLGGVEPAESLGDRRADVRVGRPQGRVAVEQAGRPVLVTGSFDGRLVGSGRVAEGEVRDLQGRRSGVGHRGLRKSVSRGIRRPCSAVPHGTPLAACVAVRGRA